jgi:hypothetical protein
MTVSFSKNIIVPKNYTMIDSSILKLTLLPSESSNISALAFNWTVIGFTDQ